MIGPDGVEYVGLDKEAIDQFVVDVSERAIANMSKPTTGWVDSVLEDTFVYVVCGLRQDFTFPDGFPTDAASHAYTAARGGYELRAAEFGWLGEDGLSEMVTDLVGHLMRTQAMSATDAVGVAASTAMNASRQERYDPEASLYLQPIGVGHDTHDRMFSMMVGCLVGNDGTGMRTVAGISNQELTIATRYGYYVHAAASSLPNEARTELAGQPQDD